MMTVYSGIPTKYRQQNNILSDHAVGTFQCFIIIFSFIRYLK